MDILPFFPTILGAVKTRSGLWKVETRMTWKSHATEASRRKSAAVRNQTHAWSCTASVHAGAAGWALRRRPGTTATSPTAHLQNRLMNQTGCWKLQAKVNKSVCGLRVGESMKGGGRRDEEMQHSETQCQLCRMGEKSLWWAIKPLEN